jgi:hypothetical protein
MGKRLRSTERQVGRQPASQPAKDIVVAPRSPVGGNRGQAVDARVAQPGFTQVPVGHTMSL